MLFKIIHNICGEIHKYCRHYRQVIGFQIFLLNVIANLLQNDVCTEFSIENLYNLVLFLYHQITNARWNNCGPSNDPFKLETLEITPSDIHFPEKMTISASAKLNGNVSSPVHVNSKLKSDEGGFLLDFSKQSQLDWKQFLPCCTVEFGDK